MLSLNHLTITATVGAEMIVLLLFMNSFGERIIPIEAIILMTTLCIYLIIFVVIFMIITKLSASMLGPRGDDENWFHQNADRISLAAYVVHAISSITGSSV